MSTAEQIIAERLRDLVLERSQDGRLWGAFPNTMSLDDLAAHVVAALTNAGKTIVELPEADEVQKALDAYAITVDPVFPILLHQNPGPYLSAEKARRFAAALLAAARVAEGGERHG